MSRRDSKVSLNNRQNDALTEFENFKKKFLLANKHITKLNSTLSVRIEELQAQISTLYVENLRLRASEIALAAQLKKEQEKSRKILADAEAATSNLSKHLGLLRQSFGTSCGPSPKLESRPVPRARRPVVDANTSPMIPRLSRAPNIPGINEDDELPSEEGGVDGANPAGLTGYRSARDRLKASTLPVFTRVASPPPLPMPLYVNLTERETSAKRKSRRQSGLLSVSTNVASSTESERGEGLIPPRAASPAFGSPIRREAGLAEDYEERRVDGMQDSGSVLVDDNDYVVKTRKEKKEKKSKQMDRETTPDEIDGATASRERERKKRRDEEVSGLKDVTNSPRSRVALPPLDINTVDRDRQRTLDSEGAAPSSAATSVATSRVFLSTPMTTPATTPQASQLPSPRCSSPIPPTPASEVDSLAISGRERRTRKSVNYAEPKLNTKMRKPDPTPPLLVTSAPKKRISTSLQGHEADPQSSTAVPPHLSASIQKPPPSSSSSSNSSSIKRKKSRSSLPVDEGDDSDGTHADAEYGYNSANWMHIDSRHRSTQNSVASGSSNPRRTPESDEARRHSFAV
ncbi:hypothetical protein SCLCIDRAFT_1223768 [Scleroderma citrinum Foug A]|uniref:Uncharacterized protein n=1 Tax=Scleroderma citrinum Foug A TaxID=1036808 RepID=A0A0C3D7N4_9AGAM|nr:hypothetical protein SCLCIDRAFT_1223768 [Scleroderma citrinum Foug A]